MCTPRQRGAYSSSAKCGSILPTPANPVIDHCPHCLNGGRVSTVQSNLPPAGWKTFDPTGDFYGTANRAGICGDPKGSNDHMIGGAFMPYRHTPVVAHWKAGSKVDFSAEIDTNHNGYFEFHICNLDECRSSDISGRCYTEGHCRRLLRVPHKDCQNPSSQSHTTCGPIDSSHPGRWYLPCRKTGHVGVHLVGGPSGTMRYQLPKDFQCKHCVVQWYYATANSCAPQGFLDYFRTYKDPFGTTCISDGGGIGAYRKGMLECRGRAVPEEFWSCADVEISPRGNGLGTTEASVPNSPPPDRMDTNLEGSRLPPRQKYLPAKSPFPKYSLPPEAFTGTLDSAAMYGDDVCVRDGFSCDGQQRCCGKESVCAYTQFSKRFECQFAWNLYNQPRPRVEKQCVGERKPCTAKTSCCGTSATCVFAKSSRQFECRYVHSLWSEM